ncbi:hypothetical protein M413DRAFT_447123 [Hebeloma cylindrosporum]|uniref:Uncharacterized protein n=1 Tax=Hebeloma cylindrosporum TaxID=76867 RepID=A0A0C2XPY3_HEBCY|nr:hypothetical protein M413DRAFT_447123 [Hebeloma cylindrosporum h7]
MAPTTEVTITIPTLEGIAIVLTAAYYATVVAHPYIVGCLLMLWSYYPEKPAQAIRYTAWTLPKNCIANIRDWLQSKAAQWRFSSSTTTPSWNSSGTYSAPTGIGCQFGCCNPITGIPYNYTSPYTYSSPYSSPYASPRPTYGAVPPITSKVYPSYKTGITECQGSCCKPITSNPYTSSYTSLLPPYADDAWGVDKGPRREEGETSGLCQVSGWGLWLCGLAVMLVYGPSSLL